MNVNRETSREVALKAGFVHCDLKTLLQLRAFRIQSQNYTYTWTFNHLRLNTSPFVLFVSPPSAYVVIAYRRVQEYLPSAYFKTDDESTIKIEFHYHQNIHIVGFGLCTEIILPLVAIFILN